MTATMIAGAASHTAVNWHAINWQKAHQIVRRLQARIVQAEQAGKRGKVKALQRLLMRRSRARQRAFERLELLEGKLSRAVCAVRRVVVSLLEAGGTKEVFLGYQSTWRGNSKGTKQTEQALPARKRCRAGHAYDPLIMRKAKLPEPES